MRYLLDTNILSEILKPKPNNRVIEWINAIPSTSLFISILTIGEIRYGIHKLPKSHKKEKIKLFLEIDIPQWFEDRILNIDLPIVEKWGKLRSAMKRPLAAIDSLIAASALTNNLCIATRNTQDFQFPELEIINPWSL